MSQNLELEIAVIRKFLNKAKCDRYIQFASSKKNRHKFIADLHQSGILQMDLFSRVTGSEHAIINKVLKENGTGGDNTCYVISDNSSIDTMTMNINDAISETVGYQLGTILVFGYAEVVFYEGEINDRYISKAIK